MPEDRLPLDNSITDSRARPTPALRRDLEITKMSDRGQLGEDPDEDELANEFSPERPWAEEMPLRSSPPMRPS